ncbi:efflux RND transporter periplasmic adaptor subunit [Mucilaginibacter sp. RS28]|uniref:Efflux RND transporter periplasmic adaptor subunit n=1 Tax=Mucilaginibacter straminoryzae TaxID=2932774 RepID=A0A9X1X7B7_9SPHI|nr:efflux RND transporter periplasmic adaptor subunit [Mucilaginibacter straminoryzae]MCJ8211480.1 efflux RND transporter periplasmic adaptor subunit [Mucilaginibacter straminoryzae]
MYSLSRIRKTAVPTTAITIAVLALYTCGGHPGQGPGGFPGAMGPQEPQPYPVFTATTHTATLNTDYPATLQGEQNIDIRPKIDGFVEKIYIDEGATVKKGQLLFTISAPQYQHDVNNAAAAVNSAKADLNSAQLQVEKTKPLVDKGIISNYELQSDEDNLQIKKAALVQAQATLATAKTNLAYTMITSPVNGVAGTIPYKIGSLVSSTSTQPLTTISNIGKVYAYFSLNEKQLLDFSRNIKGNTMAEKLGNTPAVALILSDGSSYPEKGRLETVSGLLNTETGSASFRAGFANPSGLLHSGSSALVRIPQLVKDAVLIPQKSVYELQGKHFVYVVGADNAVKSTEVTVMDLTAGQFYVVNI